MTIPAAFYRGPGILKILIIPCAGSGMGGKETHTLKCCGKKVKNSLNKRTQMDKRRKNSPLVKVKNSILIRTDRLTKKQVLQKMSKYVDQLN